MTGTSCTRKPLRTGGWGNKTAEKRDYAQRIVTTRLLYRLHDPVDRPSRLQGAYPGAR